MDRTMKLEQLIGNNTDINLRGDKNLSISSIAVNSKACIEGSLFVAVPGVRHDGNTYIPEAIEKGARAIVVQKGSVIPSCDTNVSIIEVDNPRAFLASTSALFYGEPTKALQVLGITGTNGKTTTTYLIESICREAGISIGVIGTNNIRLNGEILGKLPNTTPESLEFQRIAFEMVEAGAKVLVSEISSHAIAMNRVDTVHFDIAVFTNLSRDHLDFHGDMESYGNTKKRLFTELLVNSDKHNKVAIINLDDPWGERIACEAHTALARFSLDRESKAEFRVLEERLNMNGIVATIKYPFGEMGISSRLIGRHNLYNIIASIACAKHLSIKDNAIQSGVAKLTRVPGRLERVDNTKGKKVYIDYAHTPAALENVLTTLKALNSDRIITVFGCGGNRDKGKRSGMGRVAESLSDMVILTNDNPRDEVEETIIEDIERGFNTFKKVPGEKLKNSGSKNNYYSVILDRKEAIRVAITIMKEDDVLLIAGKGHEDYQIMGSEVFHFDDYKIASELLHV